MRSFCATLYNQYRDWASSWMVQDLNLGMSKKHFASPECPEQLWDSPNLLFSGYCGLF